jgi:hypothetical protein
MLSFSSTCAACSTHKRPSDVPWHQHGVGCPVRAHALSPTAGPVQPALIDPRPSRFGDFRDGQTQATDSMHPTRRWPLGLSLWPS